MFRPRSIHFCPIIKIQSHDPVPLSALHDGVLVAFPTIPYLLKILLRTPKIHTAPSYTKKCLVIWLSLGRGELYPVSSPNNVMQTYFICLSRFYPSIQSIEKKDSRSQKSKSEISIHNKEKPSRSVNLQTTAKTP
jgi:hypothetical protein